MKEETGKSESLTRAQVAQILGKSERMIANYVRDGKLNATYGSGKTRSVLLFDPTEVLAYKERLDSGTIDVIAAKESGSRNEEIGNEAIGSALVPISHQQRNRNTNNEIGTMHTASYFIISDEQLSKLVSSHDKEAAPASLAAKLLLTIPEAMNYSGVKEKPIRNAIRSGDLKSIRIGRSVQVRPSDLQEWVDTQFQD
jgi:excisionase family DNA binding protein